MKWSYNEIHSIESYTLHRRKYLLYNKILLQKFSSLHTHSDLLLDPSCEITYSRMLMNDCKNTTQSTSPFIYRLFNRVCAAPSASLHFKLNALLFRGMRIAFRHRRMIPRLYSSMRFTKKQRCTTACFALSSFSTFFSLRGSTYTLHQVSRKSTDACVPDLLSATLSVSSSTSSSFSQTFFSVFSLLNFSAQYPSTYYLRAQYSYVMRHHVIRRVSRVMGVFLIIFPMTVFALYRID